MPVATVVVFVVLAIVIGGLYVLAHKIEEFEKGFVYLTWIVIGLIVGTSVYLTYATPTLASHPFTGAPSSGGFTQDQSNLLQE